MTGRNKPSISFSFNKGLLAEIDKRRGIIPRSLFVEQTLINTFSESGGDGLAEDGQDR